MDVNKVCEIQKEYFLKGKTLSVSFRKQKLKELYHAINQYEKDICEALNQDLGKSKEESYMSEVGMVKTEISHMLKHLSTYAKKHYTTTPLSQFLSFSYTIANPYGTTLVLSPWNYPFLLLMDPLVCAIAAGNTVVLKPSPYSFYTNQVIQKIVSEIFEEDYVCVIEGDVEVVQKLMEQSFDFVFFTGSIQTGKWIYQKCAEKLIPCVLELGGKSPCIVEDSADISLAARRIVFGKFLNCGQTCVAPDYIYVQKNVKEQFIQELMKEIQIQFSKNPFENPVYGKMIHDRQFHRIQQMMDLTKVIYGGKCNEKTCQIEPTIMDHVSWEDKVMKEEIFGPVLPILEYENFDSLLSLLKTKPHPLALYLFTNNHNHIQKVNTELQFGGGCINDTIIHLANPNLGFGGVGESGIGKYHGKEGFRTFSHTKSIVDKKCSVDLPMRYAPYTKKIYQRLIHFFMK